MPSRSAGTRRRRLFRCRRWGRSSKAAISSAWPRPAPARRQHSSFRSCRRSPPTRLSFAGRASTTLILAPTRELAIQIDQEVASLSRNMNIRRAVVLGGVSKGPQINALKRGVHVLVATPGRLLDHVNMRSCDLSGVQTLVIDEADRMFDMGFIRDIKKIVSLIPMKRRTALFSATMPTEIRKFAYDILQDPYRVDLSTKTMVVDRIDQKVMIVRSAEKQSRLHTILKDEACSRVIVFTRTKRGADRVAERLAMAGIGAVAFHGNKAQNARQRALNDFTLGHVRVLVATDIAARGIDVSNVTHVVNFDMPLDPETYIHRVGRTARKGNQRHRHFALRSLRAAGNHRHRAADEAEDRRHR